MSDRRSEILAVAETIFAERGVKATTVRQIGASAGILSGSLYHHFESKFDIVDAILRDFSEHVISNDRAIVALDEDAITRLRKLAQFAFSLVTEHKAAVLISQNEMRYLLEHDRFAYLDEHGRQVEQCWIKVLKAGIAEGSIRRDLDPAMFFRVFRDIVAGSVHWFRPTRGKSIEQIADEVIDMLLVGIAAPTR